MNYKLIILALFVALTFLVTSRQSKEGFENKDSSEITEVITLLNDTLCPVYKIMLDDLTSDPTNPIPSQAAHAKLEKAAGGKLFPCPPPADPVQLSATLDLDLQRTINYYDTKLQEMLDTTTKALTTCATAEGFVDVCPSSAPPPPKPQSCVDPSSLSPEDHAAILKQRSISLAKVLSQEENSTKIARIKKNTKELMELKQKAERGELQPAC
jgi:hypothetical protein